jgi:threonine synthase
MNYYSLNKQSPVVSFKEAAISGQAPDKGLYFPERLPVVSDKLIAGIESLSDIDIAF